MEGPLHEGRGSRHCTHKPTASSRNPPSRGISRPLLRWENGLRDGCLTLPAKGSRCDCRLFPLPGGIFYPGRWQGWGRRVQKVAPWGP